MHPDTHDEPGLKAGKLKSLLSNTLVYGGGDALSKLASMVLLPALTFRLSPAQMGVSSLLLMWYALAGALFGLGIGAALGPGYFAAKTDRERLRTIWTAIWLLLLSSAVLLGTVAIANREIAHLLLGQETTTNGPLLLLATISAVCNMLAGPFRLRLQFEGAPFHYVLAGLLGTFATASSTLLCVFVLHWGVLGVIAGNLIGQLVLLASSIVLVASYRPMYSNAVAKDQLKVGLPLVPSFCVIFLLTQSGRYITNMGVGLSAVGIYSTATNLGLGLSVAVTALQAAWYPFFMPFINKMEEAKPVFAKVLKYYVYIYGALNLLFYVFAKPVVQLLISRQYADAMYGVGITASAEFARGAAILLLPPVYFARRLYVVTIIQVFAALVAIALGLATVRRWGWLGVSVAMFVANIAMVALHYLWNSRIYGFSVPYDFRMLWRVAVIYAVSTALITWAYHLALAPYAAVALVIVIITIRTVYATLEHTERDQLRVGISSNVALVRAVTPWHRSRPVPSGAGRLN